MIRLRGSDQATEAKLKRLVLTTGIGLFLVWVWSHLPRLTADPEGVIRLTLGIIFATWILLRGKAPSDPDAKQPFNLPPVWIAGLGTLLALFGLIFRVYQVEWIGIMTLLYACLCWSLTPRWYPDIRLALFLLYWIHPLPSRIFGLFELMLQKISIQGAEWLLHVTSIPVWADGLILYTTNLAFGVPESCSGAMTAVTVLMCILGLSVVLRLRWITGVLFALAGIAQVLLLNILRISLIVAWGRNQDQAWAHDILHDTLAIFLLVAIALIHAEAYLLTHGVERRETFALRFIPKILNDLMRGIPRVLLVVVLIGLIIYGVQRRRPYRHALLLLEVATSLQARDPERAEKAVRKAERLDPENKAIFEQRLRIMIKRKQYQEVLAEIEKLEAPSTAELVIKAQMLTALDKIEDAHTLLQGLPPDASRWPAVEMIRAEYGAVNNDIGEVLRRVRIAARDPANTPRLRALFPFLARHEQWEVIAGIEADSPHQNMEQALIGLRAFLETERFDQADGALRRALSTWSEEPRFISIAYELARQRPRRGWEERFAEGVLSHLDQFDADFLGLYIDYAFTLGRPDVAWVAYRKLAELAPADPSLDLAVARHAPRWFLFGTQDTPEGPDRLERTKQHQQWLAAYTAQWGQAPLADVLRGANPDTIRVTYGQRALAELDRRKAAGTITDRMLLQYPQVFILLDRDGEAQQHLGTIAEEYPHLQSQAWRQSAGLYAEGGQWEDAYERLRLVYAADGQPPIDVRLLMLRAAIERERGLIAMDVAKQTQARFPHSTPARIGLAAAWFLVNDPAQALLILENQDGWVQIPGLPQALYRTGRITEARTVASRMGVTFKEPGTAPSQSLDLDPAENVIDGTLSELPPRTEWTAVADRLAADRATETSPYEQPRLALEEDWFRTGGTYDANAWEAVGRDNREKAESLHRLAVLLARAGQTSEALTVLRRAAALLPSSEGIWRLIVTLAKDENTIREALKHCPSDPHIWLASLVVRVRNVKPEARTGLDGWALQEARKATQRRTSSPETLVRAGTYLMREGFLEAAGIMARAAASRARGLLAAHTFEVRCAVASANADWTLTAAHSALAVALDPEPFYRTIAYVKMDFGIGDADAKRALQYLADHAEDGLFWREKLGIAFFREPDYKRASEILRQVAAEVGEADRLRIGMLAVESDRLLGERSRVLPALRLAYAANPDRLEAINNLVYVLADTPGHIAEAKALLPKLIEMAGDDFRAFDTIALVHLRDANLEAAQAWSAKAIAAAAGIGNYHVAETYMHAAEIAFQAGDKKAALNLLETARKQPRLPPDLNRRTLELLRDIQRGKD